MTVRAERAPPVLRSRSEEHTSELQSRQYLVCRLLLEKKKTKLQMHTFFIYQISSSRDLPLNNLFTFLHLYYTDITFRLSQLPLSTFALLLYLLLLTLL